MKSKIVLIITIIMSSLYVAQEYPLNTNPSDVPNNAYIKDMNNELDKYVGLWKGTWGDKTVYLELKKVKYYYSGNHPFYSDEIFGERKIVNNTFGLIEIDRISNFDNQNPEFRGIYKSLSHVGKKRIHFYPKDMCGKTATIDIMDLTTTQMTLHLEFDPNHWKEDCQHNAYVDQYDDWPINFPKDIVLTKQ